MGCTYHPQELVQADVPEEKTAYELQRDKRVSKLAKTLGPIQEAREAL
jgi:hypothetical protein